MRTTITLDDDVAALLKRLRASSKKSLKELINTALRRGLAQSAQPFTQRAYTARPLLVGHCSFDSFDNITKILAIAESESENTLNDS